MRAHRSGIVGGVLFFVKCVLHVLSARVSLSPQNIHVFHALVYSLSVFIPVSFFVCEHPQIHSLRKIILLIQYSHFYAFCIFTIDYRYFNNVNNFQNFNNYTSEIYIGGLYTIFQLFIEFKVFYTYMKISFSRIVLQKILCFYENLFANLFRFMVEKLYIEINIFFLYGKIL